jgi:hypothetical protein
MELTSPSPKDYVVLKPQNDTGSDKSSERSSIPSTPCAALWPFPEKLIVCDAYRPSKRALREEALDDGDPPW